MTTRRRGEAGAFPAASGGQGGGEVGSCVCVLRVEPETAGSRLSAKGCQAEAPGGGWRVAASLPPGLLEVPGLSQLRPEREGEGAVSPQGFPPRGLASVLRAADKGGPRFFLPGQATKAAAGDLALAQQCNPSSQISAQEVEGQVEVEVRTFIGDTCSGYSAHGRGGERAGGEGEEGPAQQNAVGGRRGRQAGKS